ncbi:hypothetical protein [Pedobacter hiemivivus]|uniref:Macroglobulin domain-containing protein n=1 Tax=Pedobacter hiemivivus TaxID=2530454 RepID=A0A4R0NDR5_9SPHI|nr:hypothetical protein [Pedobacter hiemivivus]TCC98348.1 hypothetical protein EZ444_03410 [Pedobacter hiemivivus]
MRYWLNLILGLLIFSGHVAFAQQEQPLLVDPLAKQLYLYKLANPSPRLFVHFDKNIYTNNETVWFTGYLLTEREANISKHNIMSVALIRNSDSLVVKHQKFLMATSLSFGSMVLPDSMLAGDYHLLASTNRVSNGVPEAIFIQPITIKTNINPSFNAGLKILEQGIMGVKPNQVLLSATTRDARFLSQPVEVSYHYGHLSKKTKTNSSGEVILKLDEQEDIPDPNVYVKLKYGSDSSFLNLSLPVTKRRAKVGFYPEGGNLINGILGRVGVEVKDQQLAVVSLKAQLYKNDTVIDTIETDSYGIGSFLLKPEKGSSYRIKLLHSGFTDTSYLLPPILDKGIGIYISEAAVRDTLIAKLRTSQKENLFIRVHNFKETFIYNHLDAQNPQMTLIIPLETVPLGLNTLTISDSLGRPLAERMFFAHYNPTPKLTISSDQKVYEQRKKVTLKLRLGDSDSLAIVSVACVQERRISSKLNVDIESYSYLASSLTALPPYNTTRGYEDPKYMDNILLVKGWRRYTWQDAMKTKPSDTIKSYDNTKLSLQITGKKQPVNEPLQIGILSSSGMKLYNTDNRGYFEFNASNLAVEKEKPVYIFLGEQNKNRYLLSVNDPYAKLNKSYLNLFGPEYRAVPSSVQNNNVLSLKGNETAIRLKEVQITSGNSNNAHSPKGPNNCGDYVCSYNILNCFNHVGDPNNRPPVAGKSYHMSGGGSIIYQACETVTVNPGMVLMDGVYSKKEFYVNDYAEPLEPAFASTIYWSNGLLLNKEEREITFYTSDITGKFKVIVQGLSSKNVLYGDYIFEVKGK